LIVGWDLDVIPSASKNSKGSSDSSSFSSSRFTTKRSPNKGTRTNLFNRTASYGFCTDLIRNNRDQLRVDLQVCKGHYEPRASDNSSAATFQDFPVNLGSWRHYYLSIYGQAGRKHTAE